MFFTVSAITAMSEESQLIQTGSNYDFGKGDTRGIETFYLACPKWTHTDSGSKHCI